MSNNYNLVQHYEKNREKVQSSYLQLEPNVTEKDKKYYQFVMHDESANKDLYMDMARIYFNGRLNIQKEEKRIQTYSEKFDDFIAK
tara:strand:+ start:196405 stop:196662 length:258 start_codon:yes stop_codon:yes gene_type:complete